MVTIVIADITAIIEIDIKNYWFINVKTIRNYNAILGSGNSILLFFI